MKLQHEAELAASPEEVWKALVDPEQVRQYYYDMAVDSDWRPGATIVFSWAPGQEGESGVVVAAEPRRRLVLETKLLFGEELRSEPPHRTSWELEPRGSRTRVRLLYDVPEEARLTGRLLQDGGDAPLQGLRILVDAEARAELERLPEIGEVEVRDLTPESLDDYLRFFDEVAFRDHPAWNSCYCSETHVDASEDEHALRTGAESRELMAGLIGAGQVTALLAFADGRAVAWCNYGETTRLAGLVRKLGLEAADHAGVGSVACFVIGSRYRRHGIGERLLEAACERLAERGCSAVEAYPRREPASDADAYRGRLQMYLKAGFEPYREAGRTLVVRKALP